VRDIGACDHRLGRRAAGVHAGAAHQLTLDDGNLRRPATPIEAINSSSLGRFSALPGFDDS
jgi:hypothetical protein